MTSETDGHGGARGPAVSVTSLRTFFAEHPAVTMWLALLAGVIVRVAIAPLGAHAGDFNTFTNWANALGSHPLLEVYQNSTANYPPLALLVLDGSRLLCALLAPGKLAGPVWHICLKLPPILADMGMGWLVWRAAARRGVSLWLPLSIVFNPALIYLSGWWGQYDSLYMLPVLASLLAAGNRRFFAAGLLLGAGVMIKLQTGIVAPVLALAALRDAGDWRTGLARLAKLAGGGALMPVICLGPYAADGQAAFLAKRLVTVVSGASWPTVNALNGWYVFTLGKGNWVYNAPLLLPDNTPVVFGLSMRSIGLILLAAWLLAVLWLAFRRPRDGALSDHEALFWAGAMFILGVFLWTTQTHERWDFGAVVLLAMLAVTGWQPAARRVSWVALYGLFTVLHLLNLVWAGPFSFSLYDWYSEKLIWGLPIALATIGVAFWLMAPPRAERSEISA